MQKIGDIFSDIQEGANITNSQIYNLIEEFSNSPTTFINGLEQCYLKIIKLGSRSTKKPVERFEKITEKFFHLIYQAASNPKSRKKVEVDSVYGLFQHFLNFLSNGFDSTNVVIKQICAKHISLMLKVFSNQDIEEVLDNKVINKLIDGTISLLKSKQPSLKLLALKIASYVQKFNSDELKIELVRSMSNDESRDVRKVSLINLQIDEVTLPHLLVRTRELDSELRLLVYKKLIKEKIHLANLKLSEIYKIVYDGLLAREEGVREGCVKYLKGVYEMFKEREDQDEESNKGEDEKEGEDESSSNRRKSKTSQASNEGKKELYNKTKLEVLRFLKIFQIEKTLIHPQLYEMVELVVHSMLHDIIPPDEIKNYLRELIKVECKKNGFSNLSSEEIFFFRVVCQYVPKTKEFSDLASIIEDDFLSLAEFTKILDKCVKSKDLLSVYQLFLIADLMMNSDEIGRQSLVASIKTFCMDLDTELKLEDEEDLAQLSSDEFNDIYVKKTQEDVNLQQFARSFFDTPIVQSKNDLIPLCVGILRKILDDTNNAFSNYVLEMIALIKEPYENGADNDGNEFLSQKEKLEKKIEQCEQEAKEIEENLQAAKKKTRGAKKGANDESDKLEKDLKKLNNEKQGLEKKLNAMDDKIDLSTTRCLHLACSLLQHCKLSLNDPGIKDLLATFIGPCFQRATQHVKDLAFKCLSLYVLLDKKFTIDYMKIYKEYLDNYKTGQACEPSLLSAIKAVFDFFLAYNLLNEEGRTFDSNDEGTFDCQDLVERLIILMFDGDTYTKKVCVEGFTRLVFNKRIKNPTEILTLLMIIWHDTLVVKTGGHEIIQILSMFFRTLTSFSIQGLEMFEKSLENFMSLLVTLSESKELEFNTALVRYELNDDFIVGTVGSIGISILNGKVRDDSANKDNFGDELTPLERFFIFLCEKSSETDKNSKFFRKIFEKMLSNFNIDNLTPIKQNVLYRYLEHFCTQLPENNKEHFETFLKKLKDEEIIADESALEKISSKLDEEQKQSKNDFRAFLKSLKERDILAKKKNAGRAAAASDTREEMKDEEEESTDKKVNGAQNGKGADEGNDDEEDEEEEQKEEEEEDEEEEEAPRVKTRASQRSRKRKEPQKGKDKEPESEEEKAKPNLKKNKKGGKRK